MNAPVDLVPSKELAVEHRFGGTWTVEKLQVLKDYLGFYTKALSRQPFELVYIDTFAGTGRCQIRSGRDGEIAIDGSAKIALDCRPSFHAYHFIENNARRAQELRALLDRHPNGSRASLGQRAAHDLLPSVLEGYDWRKTRGVLFLDPYGLQCTWDMIERVAQTKALDVFFLANLSGMFRQAAVNEQSIDAGKAAALTRTWGTTAWREALYTTRQEDLFGDLHVSRTPGYEGILDFMTKRLESVFPHLEKPILLRQRRNGVPLFALYFAVANPDAKAIGLAKKVSREILSKLR